ncbi:MAG: DHA2 family efflux MFS transporter permease subunit [Actinomycetota bacterium]|nr:DHA2 family efflux MFS transporter permease subunit [Actinomycetota bacterium]
MASRPSSADEPLGREVWIVATVVVVGVIMSILDTTIVNVALETLSRELDAPLSTIQWVSTGYLLALATVIPLTGWMTERFGSKKIWMVSVLLFGLGSALCGLAWSAESLIFFRVLQGFGGGMIMPVGMALLAQTAGVGRVGRVMSVVGVPMLLGPILGPVIGGVIVDSTSWRWIFYVNVPIAVLALGLAARLLKADAGRADAGRLDWLGLALLSPGLAGIVFGLSESESHGGFADIVVWGPLVGGLVLVALFVRHAWFASRPLIDVHLFRVRAFSAAAATTFLVGGALFGAMIILPLYYQVARGESALTAGLLMAPQGLGAALAMPLAGRFTDRVGGGIVAVVGLVILTLGTIPFAFLAADTSYTLLALLLVVRGLGIGSAMMPAMAAAYATLESSAVPRATSALNVLQRIGGSLGTALLAVVLQGQVSDRLGGTGGGVLERLPADVRERVADPLAAAFASTFWWAVGMSVLALVPATILALTQRQEQRSQAEHDAAVEADKLTV